MFQNTGALAPNYQLVVIGNCRVSVIALEGGRLIILNTSNQQYLEVWIFSKSKSLHCNFIEYKKNNNSFKTIVGHSNRCTSLYHQQVLCFFLILEEARLKEYFLKTIFNYKVSFQRKDYKNIVHHSIRFTNLYQDEVLKISFYLCCLELAGQVAFFNGKHV